MSLLDEFFIQFSSNASEVAKAAEEAEKSTDDLEESLSDADEEAADLSKTLTDMAGEAKKAAKAFFALYAVRAAKGRILSLTAEADELGKFSERLNVNIEDVDAWGGAVEKSGGNASSFRSSLESLNEKLVETAIKGQGEIIPFFAQMGIAIADANGRARSTLDILPELSNAFQSLNRQESAAIGKKLGLDNATILLLQNGTAELDKLLARQKELGVLTKEDAAIAAQFNDSITEITRSLNHLGRLLAIDSIPFIKAFLGAVTETVLFFRKNKIFALTFFGAIAGIITAIYLPAIIGAATATWLLLAPFLGIAAAITAVAGAFALAADDIDNFLKGNDSVIGEVVKKWDDFKDNIIEVFDDVKKAYADFVDSLPDISIDAALNAAKQFVGFSASSPINTQTPNTIANSVSRGGDRSVKFGDVNVDARGGNGQAGKALGDAMKRELRRAVDQFDDGVLA